MKPEVIEEKIRKAENKIECESLTVAEEKDVQRDIKQWRVCYTYILLFVEGFDCG